MSDVEENAWQAQYAQRLTEIIAKHGWVAQAVGGDPQTGEPPFTYTIGLTLLDHPEFIIFGVGPDVAQSIVNDLGARVRDDKVRFTHGQVLDDVVEGFDVALVEVEDTTEHLTWANAMVKLSGPVDALQVVFPDSASRWPWQDGSRVAGLPVLGSVPDALR